jgi:hypothetical protein
VNLIVTTREADGLLRFEAQGRWEYNDALALAYQVKSASVRAGTCSVLVDLQAVTAAPGVEGKFLLWDRLHRVLPPECKVAVVAPVDLIDLQERAVPGTASVVLFPTERAAVAWLGGIKNPPVVERSRG